jgi:hypothetical protein
MSKRVLIAVALLAVSVSVSNAFAQYHPDFDGKQRVKTHVATTQAHPLRSPWDPVTGQVRGRRRHARRRRRRSADALTKGEVSLALRNRKQKLLHRRRGRK